MGVSFAPGSGVEGGLPSYPPPNIHTNTLCKLGLLAPEYTQPAPRPLSPLMSPSLPPSPSPLSLSLLQPRDERERGEGVGGWRGGIGAGRGGSCKLGLLSPHRIYNPWYYSPLPPPKKIETTLGFTIPPSGQYPRVYYPHPAGTLRLYYPTQRAIPLGLSLPPPTPNLHHKITVYIRGRHKLREPTHSCKTSTGLA